MFKDAAIYIGHMTMEFWNFCLIYWVDFGIAVSLLTLITMGVASIVVHPGSCGKDTQHKAFNDLIENIFLVGFLIAWLTPLGTITAFYVSLVVFPIYFGKYLGKLCKACRKKEPMLAEAIIHSEERK